jgi:hypothetical protein
LVFEMKLFDVIAKIEGMISHSCLLMPFGHQVSPGAHCCAV